MNWKAEAKEKLQRYDAMRLATINIPSELERLEIDAQSIRSAKLDAPAAASGGGRREDALLNNIVHRQELLWTLQQAQIWLTSTDRALSSLPPREKLILHRLYMYRGTTKQLWATFIGGKIFTMTILSRIITFSTLPIRML